MTQLQLDRAVARATGETVETIQKRGFSFQPMPQRKRNWRPRRRQARSFTKQSKGGNS